MKKPLKEDFKNLVNEHERLCDEGFVFDSYCRRMNLDSVRSKKNLLDSYKEFLLCIEWLSSCQLTKGATEFSPGSYKLKHMVERHYDTYVSNGTLITAVLYLKIPVKKYLDSPNIAIGISKKSPQYKAQKLY